jgi:diguanylate cyclase (GGDEF)-like protein
MKRFISALVVIFGCATAWASSNGPLTTIGAVKALTSAEASNGLPVAFDATVTYYRNYQRNLYVQDGNVGIFVKATTALSLVPGDRVQVRGTTQIGFRTNVLSSHIVLLHHGALPKAVPATFEELIRAKYNATLVTMHGLIGSADLVTTPVSPLRFTTLKMLTEGGYVDVQVDSDDANALKYLLDADVDVTGVAGGRFDGKMEQTGVVLHVSKLADIKIYKRAGTSPWSIPVTPMDEILAAYQVQNHTRRVRVNGTITYYEPGAAAVLQDGARSLWIQTQSSAPLRIGDKADATGFPNVNEGFLTLTGSEIQDSQVQAPINPQPVTWRQLTSSRHLFDLVSIEGQVVMEVREPSRDEYVLVSDGYLFSAIYRHTNQGDAPSLSPMKHVSVGSKVRATGICVLDSADPFDRNVPFNILLRSSDDIMEVARPSWVSIRNLILLVGLLLVVVVVVIARGWSLERKVRRQSVALAARIEAEAALERRRSRILEDINGSRPLAEVLEQIVELVSFLLDGAPCWCEVTDGARLGNRPKDSNRLHIARQEIAARIGPALGVISAGLDPLRPLNASESEALATGSRLATLAIETRHLYADLRHRSEFDLLTDIHNRFSLEKHLDALIEKARQNAGIFALIYIDLDKFKLVNDNYGHQVGDLYLQEVALRMKRQLRSADLLARLGGDEFAALIPAARSRAEVEEVAQRLKRCMDEPFTIEGCVLHGSASIGVAIYPEDGASKDTLLSFADTAMYAVKNAHE